MNFVESLIKNFGPTTFSSGKVFFTTGSKYSYPLTKISEDHLEYGTGRDRGILRVGTSYKLVGVKTKRTLEGFSTTFIIKWVR